MEPTVTTFSARIQPELYEYLLVAYPAPSVNAKVIEETQSFIDQYGYKTISRPKPYIAMASFHAREMMEETILRFMNRIFLRQPAFETALNNYSGIPPHTIYLRVQNQQPFKQLAKELSSVNSYIQSYACPPIKLETNPHLSIAGKLTETLYLRAMTDYSHRSFHEQFVVNQLALLRRSNEYDTGKTVHVFPLQQAIIHTNSFVH